MFSFRCIERETVLRNATVRMALTLTIAGLTTSLMLVIVASIAGLQAANRALEKMYSEETAVLQQLTASDEALLQVRVDLGAYETLVAQGEPTAPVLARVHAELADSNRELAAGYTVLNRVGDAEKALADTLHARRDKVVNDVLTPEIAALDQDDFMTFRTKERQAPETVFSDYKRAALALEDFQIQRQKALFESARQNYLLLLWMFGAIGAAALGLGLFARHALTVLIVKPINAAIHHFERIEAGDLTNTIDTQRPNELGRLLAALARMQAGLVTAVAQVRYGP
nr:methyl-accepting chemotaxis protein [Paraburkholderia tagetis]